MKKKYEGSKADNKADAREAKKRGMSMDQWENSPMDRKMDAGGYKSGGMVDRGSKASRGLPGWAKGKGGC